MKIAIIGAGNMGAAIARGIAPDNKNCHDIVVSNRSAGKLAVLEKENPRIKTTCDNVEAADCADILILAVKPWILSGVLAEIAKTIVERHTMVVSIAGGVPLDALAEMLEMYGVNNVPMFHVIPDTAISLAKSMTFIAALNATQPQVDTIADIFKPLGEVAVIDEDHMNAATALSSCGIAYVYKYAQACVQAGVQLGFRPDDALRYTLATIDGATAMMRSSMAPQKEIDRVTTPGGMTIKGINELEHKGFTSAVISAMLASLKK